MAIEVRHRIPAAGWLVFEQWLPQGPNAVAPIVADIDDLRVTVRVDHTCVENMGEEVTDDLINRWVNISVGWILVDVHVPEVREELEHFIGANEDWPRKADLLASTDERTLILAREYQSLGHRVLRAALTIANRLASWAYAECGQSWVRTRPDRDGRDMTSRNNEFRARVILSDGSAHRWCPPNRDLLEIGSGAREGTSITPEKWEHARRFTIGGARPDLVRELMSNAEALVNSGRTRNAVIEAVCALELAINRFAQHPDPAALRKELPSTPVSFVREREHLGFSTFVRYFMPILFDAAEMGQAIERCARALECRNNIVHNGQRTLDVAQARKHVGSVRMLLSKISSATLAGS